MVPLAVPASALLSFVEMSSTGFGGQNPRCEEPGVIIVVMAKHTPLHPLQVHVQCIDVDGFVHGVSRVAVREHTGV